MHLLIGDSSLAGLFNRTESIKDVACFLIADWATCDSGKIDGACTPVSEKWNLGYLEWVYVKLSVKILEKKPWERFGRCKYRNGLYLRCARACSTLIGRPSITRPLAFVRHTRASSSFCLLVNRNTRHDKRAAPTHLKLHEGIRHFVFVILNLDVGLAVDLHSFCN